MTVHKTRTQPPLPSPPSPSLSTHTLIIFTNTMNDTLQWDACSETLSRSSAQVDRRHAHWRGVIEDKFSSILSMIHFPKLQFRTERWPCVDAKAGTPSVASGHSVSAYTTPGPTYGIPSPTPANFLSATPMSGLLQTLRHFNIPTHFLPDI